ncbi:hypothetical protein [Halobacillus ihumii]|nr:hypothetical protein [Halobacillus ihumii]
MTTFIIELKGANGKAVKEYEAVNRKEALEKALDDGALVITEIAEGGVA